MSQGPEEVKAEQRHPAEHGEAREVKGVADGKAGLQRNHDEELFVVVGLLLVVVIVIIGDDIHIVVGHQKHSCEEDKDDVCAGEFALEWSKIIFIENLT
jgi:hypothetical protein